MAQEAGEENFFLFGLIAQQVADSSSWYSPHWHYDHEPETRAALDPISADYFSRYEPGIFAPLRDALLTHGDRTNSGCHRQIFRFAKLLIWATAECRHRFELRVRWLAGSPMPGVGANRTSRDRFCRFLGETAMPSSVSGFQRRCDPVELAQDRAIEALGR
jgi:hypothetical protein